MQNANDKSRFLTDVTKNAARGTFLVFLGNASSTAILTVTSVAIARLLGSESYGIYSIALSVVYLALLFTDFGVNPAIVRFIARYRSEGRQTFIRGLVRTGVLFEVGIGVSAVVVLMLSADILAVYLVKRPHLTSLIQLGSLTVLGSALLSTSNSVFVGLDQMGKSAFFSSLSSVVKAIVAPLLILSGFGAAGAITGHMLGFLIAGIFATLVAIVTVRSKEGVGSDVGFTSDLRVMIRYGMPLYASTLAIGLLSQYQIVLLSWFVSNVEIGNYSVTTVFSYVIYLLTTPISTSIFPAFSKLGRHNHGCERRLFFRTALRYTLLVVIPTSFFVAVMAGDLVPIFYGSGFAEAPLYLRIYSATFLLGGFSAAIAGFYNGAGRTDLTFKGALVQLMTTLFLSPPLVILLGVIGVILATIVSSACSIIYWVRHARKEYDLVFETKHVTKLIGASTISTFLALLPSLFVHSHILRIGASIVVFGLSYATFVPVTGGLTCEDLANISIVFDGAKVLRAPLHVVLSYERKVIYVIRKLSTRDTREDGRKR